MPSCNRIRRVRENVLAVSSKPVGSKPKRTSCHVQPRSPVIDLNGPGRLRTANILAIFGISHSTLYVRLKSNAFPAPDGRDGKMLFWNTQTIRPLLGMSSEKKSDL